MNQYHEDETIPVPRSRVFVLADGTFVVQWEKNRVQSLLSGRYYQYSDERFGAAISNYELNQLKNSNVVYHYDDELVYLSSASSVIQQAPTRSFYLNTALNKTYRYDVETALKNTDLLQRFSVRVQESFVIIRGPAGMPFATFDDAERAREILLSQMPDLFPQMAVAFVEIIPTS